MAKEKSASIRLTTDQKRMLEEIRDKDRKFNLTEKVGELIQNIHKQLIK